MYGKTQINKQGRKGRRNNEVRKLKGRRDKKMEWQQDHLESA